MATTKKVTATPKKPKVAAKKTVSKPKVVKTSVHSPQKTPATVPFLTFQATHQTFYWLILSGLVIALAAWVMQLSMKVQDIYDQIDATNAASSSEIIKKTPAMHS
ncbi:MAG: hypothetical protein ABIQ04_01760 [Candidatus Saccharimonadales bacterium]